MNIICGGLAGAVNYEAITGNLVGEKSHKTKGEQTIGAYENLNKKAAKTLCAKPWIKKKVKKFTSKQIGKLKLAQQGQLPIKECK